MTGLFEVTPGKYAAAFSRNPLVSFFALSLALHLLAVWLVPKAHITSKSEAPISVSILSPSLAPPKLPPVPQKTAPRRQAAPRETVPKFNASTPIAKTTSKQQSQAVVEKEPAKALPAPPAPARQTTVVKEQPREPAPDSGPVTGRSILAERPLPHVKDLLPSLTSATSASAGRTVIPLNTKDPTFVTYNGKIGQMIDTNWQFPEVAKQYGLKGKLILEFTVTSRGELVEVRLIRSSGYNLLDEEAIRAVKTAAPFPPFPPWIKDDRLVFSASMEYLNSNATVGLTR